MCGNVVISTGHGHPAPVFILIMDRESPFPPAKRQKIRVQSADRLQQQLQQRENEVARLQQQLQQQEDEVARLQQQLQLQEELHTQSLLSMGVVCYGPSFNGKTTDVDMIDNLTRLGLLAMHYNANVMNQFIRDIPEMVWGQKIIHPFLNLEDLSILRRTNTFFQAFWVSVLKLNLIRVPQGCTTLGKATALAEVFSEQKEYTKADPLKIQLEMGVHEIVGFDYRNMMNVTCSHITFVGKGKGKTTILGGVFVHGKQNVKFEELTVTNPKREFGLLLRGSETNVDVLKCSVKECGGTGMFVDCGATVTATHSEFLENRGDGVFCRDANTTAILNECKVYQNQKCGAHLDGGATVTATQCAFMENSADGVFCAEANTKARLHDCKIHHNGEDGLCAYDRAVVDLHGTKTDIHSNKQRGIEAEFHAKVNIHLPFQHNTTHDNVEEDRYHEERGSIANINADGTFTHVVVEEDDLH